MGRVPAGIFAIGAIAAPAAAAAAADHPELVLDYHAVDAPGCPDETSFRHLVAARLGYDPFVSVNPNVVHVALTRDHGALHGRIAMAHAGQPASSPRDLAGASDQCAALGEALATALAIAVDPVHALAAPPAPDVPPPSPPAPTPPAPAPAPAPARVPVPAAAPPLHVGLSELLGGFVSVGDAPTVTIGIDLGVALRVRTFALELDGRIETTPGDEQATSGDRLSVTTLTGSISPCLSLRHASGCLFARLGAVQGYAPDVTHPSLGSSLYAALGLRVAYAFPLTRALALRPSLEAAVPLVRTQLDIDGASVWTSNPWSASLGLAFVVDSL